MSRRKGGAKKSGSPKSNASSPLSSTVTTPERPKALPERHPKVAPLPEAAAETEIHHQKKLLAAARKEQEQLNLEVAALRSKNADLTDEREREKTAGRHLRYQTKLAQRDAAISARAATVSGYWTTLFLGTTAVACVALVCTQRSGTISLKA